MKRQDPNLEDRNKKASKPPIVSNSRKKVTRNPDVDVEQIQSRSLSLNDDAEDEFAGGALLRTLYDFIPLRKTLDAGTSQPIKVHKDLHPKPTDNAAMENVSIRRPSSIDNRNKPEPSNGARSPNHPLPPITMKGYKYQPVSIKPAAKAPLPPPPKHIFSGVGLSDGIGSDGVYSGTSEDLLTTDDHGRKTDLSSTESEAYLAARRTSSIAKPMVIDASSGSIHSKAKSVQSLKVQHSLVASTSSITHKPVQEPAGKPTAGPSVKAPHETVEPPKPTATSPATKTFLEHKASSEKTIPIHERLRKEYATKSGNVDAGATNTQKPHAHHHHHLKLQQKILEKSSASSSESSEESSEESADSSDDSHDSGKSGSDESLNILKAPAKLTKPVEVQHPPQKPPAPAQANVEVPHPHQKPSAPPQAKAAIPAQQLKPIVYRFPSKNPAKVSPSPGIGVTRHDSHHHHQHLKPTHLQKPGTAHTRAPKFMISVKKRRKIKVKPLHYPVVGTRLSANTLFPNSRMWKPKTVAGKKIERGKTDYLCNNALAAIRKPPKIPIPRYIDHYNGESHLWCPSGFARFYIFKPDFGRVPVYIKERMKELGVKRKKQRNSASAPTITDSESSANPTRGGNEPVDHEFGANFYSGIKQNPAAGRLEHDPHSWNQILLRRDEDNQIIRQHRRAEHCPNTNIFPHLLYKTEAEVEEDLPEAENDDEDEDNDEDDHYSGDEDDESENDSEEDESEDDD